MGLDSHVVKTNREEQWQMLKSSMVKHGATRKNLRNCENYFFNKIDCGNFTVIDKFLFYPEPTFEGWQRLFDDEISEMLSDQDFKDLNKMFCGHLADYFFCIEDQNYYFNVTFGEVYDSERKFPLRINREPKLRNIALTPNAIFLNLVNRFSRWLKAKEQEEQGVLRFNHQYFESLLPYIERTPFSDREDLPRETADGSARPKIARAGVKTILKFNFMEPNSESDKDRIQAAKAITEILMDHADDLGDLRTLYDQATNESKRA